ncbi:MAG: hypothetical protein ABI140_06905 [Jatrophihabitantaceae bacterium]
MTAPTTPQLGATDPQRLLDYVNSVALISAYAAAVAQTKPPVLELTPPWYASYIEAFELVQSHALEWTNGTLPELQQLPTALLQADALVQQQLEATTAALANLAMSPASGPLQQAALTALGSLSTTSGSAHKTLDDLQATVTAFTTQLANDSATLTDMSAAASKAAGADSTEVAKLTEVVSQLQAAIATRQEIAHLENLLKGDLAIFLVVVAMTVGWLGGPIIDGLLGMAAIGLLAGIGKNLASEPDIVALQTSITNVQKEISAESAELAIVQATVSTFAQLAAQGAQAQGALAEIASTWAAQIQQVDAVAADLATATGEVSAAQIGAAQAEVANAGVLWTLITSAMKILAGVTWNVGDSPVAIG